MSTLNCHPRESTFPPRSCSARCFSSPLEGEVCEYGAIRMTGMGEGLSALVREETLLKRANFIRAHAREPLTHVCEARTSVVAHLSLKGRGGMPCAAFALWQGGA